MVRPLRIEFPGALYHVTSRGNRRQNIFLTDKDRQLFLSILWQSFSTHNVHCYAYCLMDNHYHLLIETLEGNLSEVMRDVNSVYSRKFNKNHGQVGHVLQGRYKSFLIEKEAYLLKLIQYTVLNPVRASMVQSPDDWKWSSYTATRSGDVSNARLRVGDVLSYFDVDMHVAGEQYEQFVIAGIGEKSPFEDIREGLVLGSEEFVEAYAVHDNIVHDADIVVAERLTGRPSLDELFDADDSTAIRNEKIICARNSCGYSVTDIAEHLNLHRTTVSKIVNDRADATSHGLTP